jgi:hypothetical protein
MAEPEIARSNEQMLSEFLRDRDVACPRCGYNLRNLKQSACPECGDAIRIGVLVDSLPTGWLILALIPVAVGLGIAFLSLIIVVAEPEARSVAATTIIAFGVLDFCIIAWLCARGARFLRVHVTRQFIFAILSWALHALALGMTFALA